MDSTYSRFGNSERNQRLHLQRGQLARKPVWQTPLPDHITPLYLIAGGGCVVLIAVEGWLLFSAEGKLLHRGISGSGEPTIDARARLLYAPTETGYVDAFSLDDGTRRFYLTPLFGHEFRRDFIQRSGTRMIIASVERKRPSHALVPANLSVIEIQDLSRPPEIDSFGWLESAERTKYLKRKTVELRVAMHADELAFAMEDSLNLSNLDLDAHQKFTDSFRPVWLSVDELMRCYLIVRTRNHLALWVVTRDGMRVLDFALPDGVRPISPPVVGHDHTAYVISGNDVIAINVDGTTRWQNHEPSQIKGAGITFDNGLVIAAGPELAVYESDGKRKTLLILENDTFLTPPAAGDNGELFLAGAQSLYRIQ